MLLYCYCVKRVVNDDSSLSLSLHSFGSIQELQFIRKINCYFLLLSVNCFSLFKKKLKKNTEISGIQRFNCLLVFTITPKRYSNPPELKACCKPIQCRDPLYASILLSKHMHTAPGWKTIQTNRHRECSQNTPTCMHATRLKMGWGALHMLQSFIFFIIL